jgi:hypothetical protein
MLSGQPPVRDIGNRLSDGAECRGGFDPTHWQCEGNSDKWFFAGTRREDNSKFGRRVGSKPDAIKAVTDVNFVHVDRPVLRISVLYAKQQPV